MLWALVPAQGLRVQPIHACGLYSSSEVHYDCSTKGLLKQKDTGSVQQQTTQAPEHKVAAAPVGHLICGTYTQHMAVRAHGTAPYLLPTSAVYHIDQPKQANKSMQHSSNSPNAN
jgi:hypothetical protein